MSRSATSPTTPGRPRKSPLRLSTLGEPFLAPQRNGHLSPPQLRLMMVGEFEQWLRSRTNKEKRPFQEDTILAYAKAARALDAWMTGQEVDGDFTACDTRLLNRFSATTTPPILAVARTPSNEAIPLMEQTLADSERVLGPDNPQTLAFKKHVEGMIREPP
jgi:hypothetical protein